MFQVSEWSFMLRSIANGLNGENVELANHFYNVHYAIGNTENQFETDPFKLDEDYLALSDVCIESIRDSVQVVLKNIDLLQKDQQEKFKQYLIELQANLEKK
jgi:hypothetical protein